MRIFLSPQRRDDTLEVIKAGDILSINGENFDLSPMGDGDTLPYGAINSLWFANNVEKIDGELVVTLLFPNPRNYSQAQAFPEPLIDVPDGVVVFPEPSMPAGEEYVPRQPDPNAVLSVGAIDWSQLITKAMKDEALRASQFAEVKAKLAVKNARAVGLIAYIQDRIDTLSYGIEIGEATPEEEAEQATLAAPLKAWKVYKYTLGKVTSQPGWFDSPVWPVEPPVPDIAAAPMLAATETV